MREMHTNQEQSNRSTYSELLLQQRELLVEKFTREVRNEVPSAKPLDDLTLKNSLLDFLNTVVQIIATEENATGEEYLKENMRISRLHGQSRAQIPTYTLDQVITEFRILRRLIFHLLETSGPLPPIERDKVFFAIDNGMTQAATEFTVLRGFSDARLSEEISAKVSAVDEAEGLRNSIGKMEHEEKQRERLVSSVTHDIRNPLSIARACAEMIERQPQNVDATKKFTAKIKASIDRANLMIKDLLDSNRIKSGEKLSLNRVDCDLVTLVKQVHEDLKEVYGDRFILNCPPSTKGYFDQEGIRRALENLITNAIKYGSSEKITISVAQNEDEIQTKVCNEGNPIPLKEQGRLFEYYHRTEEAKKGSQQGWGIGLTLVKGIVEAHDGRVEVRSSKGEGTTFSMIFPKHSS